MAYIKEPKNVDFVVSTSVLTIEDKNLISDAIALYRKSGKVPENADIIIGSKSQSSTNNSHNHSKKPEINKKVKV